MTDDIHVTCLRAVCDTPVPPGVNYLGYFSDSVQMWVGEGDRAKTPGSTVLRWGCCGGPPGCGAGPATAGGTGYIGLVDRGGQLTD